MRSLLPKSLRHHIDVSFELDFSDIRPAESGWSGVATSPVGFIAEAQAPSASATCDLLHELATSAFGAGVVSHYRYTDAGYAQAHIEEEPERLACPLCNRDHPRHETVLAELGVLSEAVPSKRFRQSPTAWPD